MNHTQPGIQPVEHIMQKPKQGALLRILSNSERGTYACHRKWFFRYVLGLTTSHTPAPLRMGSLWHACLEHFYRALQTSQQFHAPAPQSEEMLATVVTAVINPWVEKRLAWMDSEEIPAEQLAELVTEDLTLTALTMAMFRGYLGAWLASDVADWEILHVECQVARPILHPSTGKPLQDVTQVSGKRRLRVWCYGGQLDLVVRKRSDGSVWFVEHKTTADSDLQKYKKKLVWDPQIKGYSWALRDPIAGSDVKAALEPVGVIYNVARKKAPAIPKLVKATKADAERMPRSVLADKDEDGKPTLQRLSASACDTTRDTFLAEVLRLGFDPDDHADALEQLRGATFFDREHIFISEPELEDFAEDVQHSALDMIREQKLPHHTRQVSVCTGAGALPCPYAGNVCLQDGPMARRSFQTMGIRHAELHGDFAEPYVAQEDVRANAVAKREEKTVDPFAATDSIASEVKHNYDPFADDV